MTILTDQCTRVTLQRPSMATREGEEKRKGNNMTLDAYTNISLNCPQRREAELCALSPAALFKWMSWGNCDAASRLTCSGKLTRVKPLQQTAKRA